MQQVNTGYGSKWKMLSSNRWEKMRNVYSIYIYSYCSMAISGGGWYPDIFPLFTWYVHIISIADPFELRLWHSKVGFLTSDLTRSGTYWIWLQRSYREHLVLKIWAFYGALISEVSFVYGTIWTKRMKKERLPQQNLILGSRHPVADFEGAPHPRPGKSLVQTGREANQLGILTMYNDIVQNVEWIQRAAAIHWYGLLGFAFRILCSANSLVFSFWIETANGRQFFGVPMAPLALRKPICRQEKLQSTVQILRLMENLKLKKVR